MHDTQSQGNLNVTFCGETKRNKQCNTQVSSIRQIQRDPSRRSKEDTLECYAPQMYQPGNEAQI